MGARHAVSGQTFVRLSCSPIIAATASVQAHWKQFCRAREREATGYTAAVCSVVPSLPLKGESATDANRSISGAQCQVGASGEQSTKRPQRTQLNRQLNGHPRTSALGHSARQEETRWDSVLANLLCISYPTISKWGLPRCPKGIPSQPTIGWECRPHCASACIGLPPQQTSSFDAQRASTD